ncbi:hypothetical protein F4804DRAFT_294866 [Jackrogersella minutella]|nr:hypothetical protein F4804DRAFT_294866 [Jackrogersella minutella]
MRNTLQGFELACYQFYTYVSSLTIAMADNKNLPGFPSLSPAIIIRVDIGDVNPLGVIHSGSKLTHYGIPSGTIQTVPGFEPAFKANVSFGADWLSLDSDLQHGRVDVKGIARTVEGHSIDFRYTGVIKLSPEVHKILGLASDAKTVPFGLSTCSHTFVVADPALKKLENSSFVSNGCFIISETGLIAETRLSIVVPSTDMP